MEYTKLNYTEIESKEGLHFLRDPLQCEQLGVGVIDVDNGRAGSIHDHGDEGQEEVYLLIKGSARLIINDEEIPLEPGDAVRVDPDETRQALLDGESLMVVVGAP